MSGNKRKIAGLLGILMILMVLASSAYLIAEAGHDCAGESCHICQQLAQTEALLQGMAYLGAVLPAAFAALTAIRALRFSRGARVYRVSTLIFWKVRLND